MKILLPFITPKFWKKHKFLSFSNTLADFNSSQKISPKIFLPKLILTKILKKSSSQKCSPKKFSKKSSPKNSQDFENIQLPTSHLEAENPFGLVCLKNYFFLEKLFFCRQINFLSKFFFLLKNYFIDEKLFFIQEFIFFY